MGSGGGTSDGPQNPQAIAQRMAPRREEQRLRQASFVTGDQSYVTGGGDIVRDSSGRGVLTGVGVQRAEASRQQDLETLISLRTGGEGDPAQEKRDMAIRQLEKRKEQTLPGFLGAISRMNIERQLADLRAGGTPQFGMTGSGNFVVRGATAAGDETPSAATNIQPMFGAMGVESTITPEITPEVTEEFVPDDTTLMGGRERGRRRTRGTRAGGAGSFETGYGVLLRGPSATVPSGSGRLT